MLPEQGSGSDLLYSYNVNIKYYSIKYTNLHFSGITRKYGCQFKVMLSLCIYIIG